MDYSPALSTASDFSDMTDEELDKYFASCAPLSNLPTPPPVKNIAPIPSLVAACLDGPHQTPELEGYACQLSNLVPTNVAPTQPHVPTVLAFLQRAHLPAEMVAFAACVLDALSQRFASSWRSACSPRQPELNYFSLKRTLPVGPEVVVLSALSLAHGFLSDCDRSSGHWARVEGGSRFTIKEIETTKWCILQELDFGLHRITGAMVQKMLKDLQLSAVSPAATMRAASALLKTTDAPSRLQDRRPKSLVDLHGQAVWKHGIQTPEPSP